MAQRIALVSAFPPGCQSLNEYGLHLAKGLADRADVSEVVVIADTLDQPIAELDLGPKIRVQRVWRFNDALATPKILRALFKANAAGVLWNLQSATFGDREIPAALGHFAPPLARVFGLKSGVIAHNIIAGIDLDSTQLKGQKLRQAVVKFGASVACRALLAANYTTVTLQGYYDYIRKTYPSAEVRLVPHGTFEVYDGELRPLAKRPKRIVTMGKFGTYKRLETLLDAFDLLRGDPEFGDYQLVIGGTDHPGTPGYVDTLRQERRNDTGVSFHGYVAEDDIADFFGEARLSIFDYTATTGSSGVLHQAASYGAVPVFPQIGDFIDICRDEGLSGAHYQVSNSASMAKAMRNMLRDLVAAQTVADSNLEVSQEMPFAEIVDFHVQRLLNNEPSETDTFGPAGSPSKSQKFGEAT